ncbi:MAG: hypothetical protein AB4290_16400 [Spirulina sp.]
MYPNPLSAIAPQNLLVGGELFGSPFLIFATSFGSRGREYKRSPDGDRRQCRQKYRIVFKKMLKIENSR